MARALTLFVRHELPDHQRRLLESLNVAVVIDEAAPACAFKAGAGGRWRACPRCLAIDQQLRDRARGIAGELHNRARRHRSG